MSDQEMRVLNEMSGKVGRLEANYESTAAALKELTAGLNRLVEKLDKSDDIAREALLSVKQAHHRLTDLGEQIAEVSRHYDGEVKALGTRIDNENTKRKEGQRWVIGVVVSVCAICTTIIFNLI